MKPTWHLLHKIPYTTHKIMLRKLNIDVAQHKTRPTFW